MVNSAKHSAQSGLKRGDVCIDDKGYYCFKRRSVVVDIKSSDTHRAVHVVATSSDELEEIAQHMKDQVNWSALMHDVASGEDKDHSPMLANEQTMKTLQDAYDNMSASMTHIKKICREISVLSQNYNDLLAEVLGLCKQVSGAISDMDVLMVSTKVATNSQVLETLRGHSKVFECLMLKGSEIVSILAQLKKNNTKEGGKRSRKAITSQ